MNGIDLGVLVWTGACIGAFLILRRLGLLRVAYQGFLALLYFGTGIAILLLGFITSDPPFSLFAPFVVLVSVWYLLFAQYTYVIRWVPTDRTDGRILGLNVIGQVVAWIEFGYDDTPAKGKVFPRYWTRSGQMVGSKDFPDLESAKRYLRGRAKHPHPP